MLPGSSSPAAGAVTPPRARRRRPGAAWARALAAGVLLVGAGVCSPAQAADWATILAYPGVYADNPASDNAIRIEQFEAHLAEIQAGGYHILPLPEVIAALRQHRALPDRTVAITIDEARESVYTEAWPRLRKAGLPFTLFVATDPVDSKTPGYLSWAQIREMAATGVTIGNLTASEPHLPEQTPARVAAEIERANRRLAEELGPAPQMFAYPFGEWSAAVRDQVAAAGFQAGFGRQSGAAHGGDDWFMLPRFVMSQAYASLGRFRLAASALPLLVREVTPTDALLSRNPPAFGFTLDPTLHDEPQLACFASNLSAPARLERLDSGRVEVRLEQPFPPGRGRINCTMPGPDGRWRWFGMQFYIPDTP